MTMIAERPAPAATSTPTSIREYFSQQQDLFTKSDAKQIGPELERLAAMGKTKLRDVVDAARPEGSPLHRYFEWDDRRAAEGFRQLQAGRMTRAICVYTVSGGQERSEPAFRPVIVKVVASQKPADVNHVSSAPKTAADSAADSFDQGAPPTRTLTAPAERATQDATRPVRPNAGDAESCVFDQALEGLRGWVRTYGRYQDQPSFRAVFEPVFQAIEEARGRAGGTI